MHHPTDRITHTTAFAMPVVEHRLEREIAQWVHQKDRSDDPSHEHEHDTLTCLQISSCSRINFQRLASPSTKQARGVGHASQSEITSLTHSLGDL